MSRPRLDIDKFRFAYRKLLEEIVRLAESVPNLPSEWTSSLLETPLTFPRELEELPRFARLAATFLKLTSGATCVAHAAC